MPLKFPPVESANEDGLLAIGGNMSVENLSQAYRRGIFPWPVAENFPLTWFAPDPRGVIVLNEFRVPRSLKKFLARRPYAIKFNRDFEQIVRKCASVKRSHEEGTWISEEIIGAYCAMFSAGKAYCVGAYEEGRLVGGLYGVCVGEIVSGESMFFERSNASKAALAALVSKLRGSGLAFLDTQMVTPVVASLGGKNVKRKTFMDWLSQLDPERPRSDIFGA